MVRTSIFTRAPARIAKRLLAVTIVAFTWQAGFANAHSDPAATDTTPASTEVPHPLDPALRLASDCLQHSQSHVRDYTAYLTKRCRVGGQLSDYQQAYVKIRNRRVERDHVTTPMSVYMKFLKPTSVQGRELIWVEGRNKGQIVAHEAGLKNLLSVNLDPNGSIAMRGQRYPITEIGLEKLLHQIIKKGNRDRQHDECQVEFYRDAKVDGRSCRMVQILHPVKRSHFDFHRAQVFFDDELNLAVRYASWSWPAEPGSQPPLEEEYSYTKVTINVGLTDHDFDPDNPEYDFW
jgi:hypothetical protein